MSWDIFVQDIPPLARSVKEIPDYFDPKPIGKLSDLVARIREVVPNADFSSPAWGSIEGPGYSIEVNMGDDERVEELRISRPRRRSGQFRDIRRPRASWPSYL
jgi:hypothetical protein